MVNLSEGIEIEEPAFFLDWNITQSKFCEHFRLSKGPSSFDFEHLFTCRIFGSISASCRAHFSKHKLLSVYFRSDNAEFYHSIKAGLIDCMGPPHQQTPGEYVDHPKLIWEIDRVKVALSAYDYWGCMIQGLDFSF